MAKKWRNSYNKMPADRRAVIEAKVQKTLGQIATQATDLCYRQVTSVSVTGLYTLFIHFDDGLEGTVRFEPSAFRGVFSVLSDPENFKQASISDGAVTWPGDLDLAPDAMYAEIKAHGVWVLD